MAKKKRSQFEGVVFCVEEKNEYYSIVIREETCSRIFSFSTFFMKKVIKYLLL